MVTITKTYEKIAPKLDDMVRRFSDIELKYGSQNEIYTPWGIWKLLAEDFRKLYLERNDIPQDFRQMPQ
jgi:hypothetical protein